MRYGIVNSLDNQGNAVVKSKEREVLVSECPPWVRDGDIIPFGYTRHGSRPLFRRLECRGKMIQMLSEDVCLVDDSGTKVRVARTRDWVKKGDVIGYQVTGFGKKRNRGIFIDKTIAGSIVIVGHCPIEYETKDQRLGGEFYAVLGFGELYSIIRNTFLTAFQEDQYSEMKSALANDKGFRDFSYFWSFVSDPNFVNKRLSGILLDFSIEGGAKKEEHKFIDFRAFGRDPKDGLERREYSRMLWPILRKHLL